MFFQQLYWEKSEWSLSLEIMCMHFILSGPHTSLHICNHIHYKKIEKQFSENEGGGQRLFGIFPKINSIWFPYILRGKTPFRIRIIFLSLDLDCMRFRIHSLLVLFMYRYLLLWTFWPLTIFEIWIVFFHYLSRPTPPHQVGN